MDLAGAVSLLIGLLLLFYALAQSAHAHSPLNAETLGFIIAGLVVLSLFLFIERRAQEPIIPLELFTCRSIFRACSELRRRAPDWF